MKRLARFVAFVLIVGLLGGMPSATVAQSGDQMNVTIDYIAVDQYESDNIIKAYVVLKQDIKGITGYDLIKWCRQTLVAYKVPQYIEFRDMLPKSKVGKLLRREVRDQERRRKET